MAQRKTRAVLGGDPALAQGQTLLRTVTAHHLFAQGKRAKRQVVTRWLTEVGQLVVQTRRRMHGLGERRAQGTPHALPTLQTRHAVAKRLIPPIVQWLTPGGVAKGQIGHVGVT